jgi:hypothetical protein
VPTPQANLGCVARAYKPISASFSEAHRRELRPPASRGRGRRDPVPHTREQARQPRLHYPLSTRPVPAAQAGLGSALTRGSGRHLAGAGEGAGLCSRAVRHSRDDPVGVCCTAARRRSKMNTPAQHPSAPTPRFQHPAHPNVVVPRVPERGRGLRGLRPARGADRVIHTNALWP